MEAVRLKHSGVVIEGHGRILVGYEATGGFSVALEISVDVVPQRLCGRVHRQIGRLRNPDGQDVPHTVILAQLEKLENVAYDLL